MYSRSYGEDRELVVPESYGGTALKDEPRPEERPPACGTEELHKESEVKASANPFSVFERIPILSSFKGMLGGAQGLGGLFHMPERVGIEELLIIGVGLYLLFSKEGDRECALIMLAVLFIA